MNEVLAYLLFVLCGFALAFGLILQARRGLSGRNVLPAYGLKFASLGAFFYLLSQEFASVAWASAAYLGSALLGILLHLVARRKNVS